MRRAWDCGMRGRCIDAATWPRRRARPARRYSGPWVPTSPARRRSPPGAIWWCRRCATRRGRCISGRSTAISRSGRTPARRPAGCCWRRPIRRRRSTSSACACPTVWAGAAASGGNPIARRWPGRWAAPWDALGARVAPSLQATLEDGFGADDAAEDRFDSLLGLTCVLSVLGGSRPDAIPEDPWIRQWEGWVLGQRSGI